jgi:hypothetical protein
MLWSAVTDSLGNCFCNTNCSRNSSSKGDGCINSDPGIVLLLVVEVVAAAAAVVVVIAALEIVISHLDFY